MSFLESVFLKHSGKLVNGIIIIGLGLNVSRKYMIMSYDINELVNFTCHKLHIHRDLAV